MDYNDELALRNQAQAWAQKLEALMRAMGVDDIDMAAEMLRIQEVRQNGWRIVTMVDGCRVSTVELALCHNYAEGHRGGFDCKHQKGDCILFETMVFCDGPVKHLRHDRYSKRYDSLAAASDDHDRLVGLLKAGRQCLD